MTNKVLLILICVVTLFALCSCGTIERRQEISDLRRDLAIAQEQGADPEVIAELEARIDVLEEEETKSPIIDTGNQAVNQGLEWLIALGLGYVGIRYWRGSPASRKGNPPTNGTPT